MKKGDKIKEELEAATKDLDDIRFKKAYNKALESNCMTEKERSRYYLNYLEARHNAKNNTIIPF